MSFFSKFTESIFGKITNLFKSKDLEGNITNFQTRIDSIVNDLLLPYTQPEKGKDNMQFRDIINLLDPKKCNKIAITLSSNLDKNYTKLQLEQFSSSILLGKESPECKDESCSDNAEKTIDNKNSKVSKKEICNAIAVHYVKILNVIAAILTAVNPSDNICLNRLRNLLTIINEDEEQGVSSICDIRNTVVKDSIMNEPGMKELLMLYYYHLQQDSETESEKLNVKNQYKNLVATFSNVVMFVNSNLKKYKEPTISMKKSNEEAELEQLEDEENQDELESGIGNEGEITKEKEISNELNESNMNTPRATSQNVSKLADNINKFKTEENEKLQKIANNIEKLTKFIEVLQRKNNSNTVTSNKNSQSNIQANTTLEQPNTTLEQPNTTLEQPNTTITPSISNQPNTTITPSISNQPNTTITPSISNQPNTTITPSISNQPNTTTTTSISNQPNTTTITPSISNQPTITPTSSSNIITSNATPSTRYSPAQLDLLKTSPTKTNTGEVSNEIKKINTLLNTKSNPVNNTLSGGSNNNNTNKTKKKTNNQNVNKTKKNGNKTGNGNGNGNNNENNNGNNNEIENNNGNNNENENENENESATESGNEPVTETGNEPVTETGNETATATEPPAVTESETENGNENENENVNLNINETENVSENGNNISNSSISNPMIKKFVDFVNIYSKVDNIDEKTLEIVNTAFKSYHNYEPNSSETSESSDESMYISEDAMEEMCVKNINDKSMIPISLNDSNPNMITYIKIYKDMKDDYITNCNELFTILENRVLEKSINSEKDEVEHFKIKNIGYDDLVVIESEVRDKLSNMYALCHKQYQEGIVYLFKALKDKNA